MSDSHIRVFNLGQLLTRRHPRAAFAQPAYIAGTVQVEGQPVRRRVRCIERQTGRFIAETWSAADGSYRFDDLYPGRAYQIIAMDYERQYNAVIADNVAPVLGGVEWPTQPEEELLAPVNLEASYDKDAGINTLTWRNVNHTQEAVRVYRSTSPIDPENLPAPLAELGGFVDSFDDDTVVEDTTYYYRVSATRDEVENVGSEIESTPVAEDFSTAQIGDEIGGGIYAGIHTISGVDFYIISAKSSGETAESIAWKVDDTHTPGTNDSNDGMSNTNAIESSGLLNHPAAKHCRDYVGGGYSDWYLPSRNEAYLVYNNLSGSPEFSDLVTSDKYLWSSTENDSDDVYIRKFSSDYEGTSADIGGGKTNSFFCRARPIRRVPV